MATQSLARLRGIAAGDLPPLWVSGSTVAQWQLRTSPLDGEVYQRKAATGAGTTDPADDLTNYTAWSYQRTTALSNAWSGGAAATAFGGAVNMRNAVNTSPALSATVRTSALSINGKGNLVGIFLQRYAGGGGGTAMNVRTELLVDGRAIFDTTNNFAGASTNYHYVCPAGVPMIDSAVLSSGILVPQGGSSGIEFARSLQVFLTASIAPVAPQQLNFSYAYSLRG